MEEPTVRFRSWAATLANTVPTVLALLLGVIFVVAAPEVWTKVAGIALFVVAGPLGVRMLFAPVRLTSTTISWRRFWSYHTVPVADVTGAGRRPSEAFLPWQSLRIDTEDQVVVVPELASIGPLGRRSVDAAIDAINVAATRSTQGS